MDAVMADLNALSAPSAKDREHNDKINAVRLKYMGPSVADMYDPNAGFWQNWAVVMAYSEGGDLGAVAARIAAVAANEAVNAALGDPRGKLEADYSANGAGLGGGYFFYSSGNITWSNAYDSTDGLSGISGTLYPNGTLTVDVLRGPGTPSSSKMLGHLADAIGMNNVLALEGNWNAFPPMNLNYRQYKAMVKSGFHPRYAAQMTWTGQRAWDLGLRYVQITKDTRIQVRTTFTRIPGRF